MTAIGKLTFEIEWNIPKCFVFCTSDREFRDSPSFSFTNATWCLRMYLNTFYRYPYCNGLFLRRISPGPPINLIFSLGFKDLSGKKVAVKHYECNFETTGHNIVVERGNYKYPSTSRCYLDKDKLLQSGVLTIFCTLKLKYPGPIIDESDDSMLQSTNILHENKVLHDFKELLLNQKDCDVILRVNGKDFRAHRTILAARSPVFESTFQNETKENMTDTVDIEDCDPSCFPDFLCFIYCGDVDAITKTNVFGLFTIADKYDVQDLKSKCVEFMKGKMSVDTFCETIALAHRHSEVELINFATDFFLRNAQKVIATAKWQLFLTENPKQSNELFMKFAASANCTHACSST